MEDKVEFNINGKWVDANFTYLRSGKDRRQKDRRSGDRRKQDRRR